MDAIEYFKGMRKRLCEDHLKLLPKKSVGYQTTLREMSFYDAAIKALEQEPCDKYIKEIDHLRKYIYKLETQIVDQEPSDDAISRNAAIDALKHLSKNYAGIGRREYHPHIDFVIDVITMLPSVSTEKTGRWERRIVDSGYNADWSCSCCGYKVKTDFVNFNYCPNCGAKMQEVEE